MNYVIEQEQQLQELTDNFNNKNYTISKLAEIMKHQETKLADIINHQEIKNEELKSISTILQDSILSIKKIHEEYNLILNTTLEKIIEMIKNGAQLSTKDNKNNTVLNFCKTKEIYETLRSHGAPFQFDVWFEFIEKPSTSQILSASVHALVISYLGYQFVNKRWPL